MKLRFNWRHKQQYTNQDYTTCFLTLIGKGHKTHILLPDNFDMDRHLEQYPPIRYGFKPNQLFIKDKAYGILMLLSTIPARNKDLIDENGYIPIHARSIQRTIQDYKNYINYFVNSDVITIWDHGRYTIGIKAKKYRWANRFITSRFSIREVECKYEDTKSMADTPKDSSHTALIIPSYISYWYDQNKLHLSHQADEYVSKLRPQDSSLDEYIHKTPQYLRALYNVNNIRHHQYHLHIDNSVHRLHSTLTFMQKELRHFLSYDGHALAGIDIKNCKPYTACLILNPNFWTPNSNLPLHFNILPACIKSLFSPSLIHTIINYLNSVPSEIFDSYRNAVTSATRDIYEMIMDKVNALDVKNTYSRDDAKTLMFYILFSKNGYKHNNQTYRKIKWEFSHTLFPEVAKLFHIIKQHDNSSTCDKEHSRLSRLLMSIESHIILNVCCQRIWNDRNGTIPIFTIHDCIITTRDNIDYTTNVINEVFTSYIGITPKLSIELLDSNN